MERRTPSKAGRGRASLLKSMAQRALIGRGGPGPAGRRPARAACRPEQARSSRSCATRQGGVILPQDPQAGQSSGEIHAATPDASGLIPEGTILVERPGRLVSDGGRPMFVFLTSATGGRPQSMELLPCQLLEALERESARSSEFTVSGE